MELDYKIILWVITFCMAIWGYLIYIRDMLKWKTKPHLFSWLVFSILWIISFLIQHNDWAGPWAWWALWATLITFVITLLAFKYGSKDITKSDTISFILALISVVFYIVIPDPTYSLLLVMLILALALYPTFRKSWYKSTEETFITYVLVWIRYFLSIFAISHFSFLTLAYPIYLLIINVSLLSLLIIRKKTLNIK